MATFLSLLISALLVGVDQITKFLAVEYLKGQAPIPLWPDVFELQYCENPGVAFSMLEHQSWVFVPLTVLLMGAITVVLIRSKLCTHPVFRVSCLLILAGGIGNLIDRVLLGYVVDFLYFKLIDFPIFNFADCCVVIGAVLLVVYLLFVYKDTDESLTAQLFGLKKRTKENEDVG